MMHTILNDYRLIEELDYVKFFSDPSGETLIAEFQESTTIDAAMAKESLDLIRQYKKYRSTFGITDASAKFLDFTAEAREYYRENMIKGETILHAIVVKDSATKILANIYARFEKPKVPTRVFTNFKDAVNWIEEGKL